MNYLRPKEDRVIIPVDISREVFESEQLADVLKAQMDRHLLALSADSPRYVVLRVKLDGHDHDLLFERRASNV